MNNARSCLYTNLNHIKSFSTRDAASKIPLNGTLIPSCSFTTYQPHLGFLEWHTSSCHSSLPFSTKLNSHFWGLCHLNPLQPLDKVMSSLYLISLFLSHCTVAQGSHWGFLGPEESLPMGQAQCFLCFPFPPPPCKCIFISVSGKKERRPGHYPMPKNAQCIVISKLWITIYLITAAKWELEKLYWGILYHLGK